MQHADAVGVANVAEKQIRSQMLKANNSSAGAGQVEAVAADTAALVSDKLHTDIGTGGGITVVKEPLGVAEAKDGGLNQQRTSADAAAAAEGGGAAGTSLRDAVKSAGGAAVAAGSAQQAAGGQGACLPTKWTGNAADYKLTKYAGCPASRLVDVRCKSG